MRSTFLVASLLWVACSSDNNTTPDASSNDASTGNDVSNVPDAAGDSSQQPDGSPTDSGSDGALPPIVCGATTVIDTVHKANSPVLATHVTGGKYVVAWGETTSNVLKARFYDGSTWQAEHPFTGTAAVGSMMGKLATDGLGNSILEWLAFGAGSSYAAVMSGAGTWGSETPFAMAGWTDATTLAAGGGALIFTDNSNVKTTLYSTGSSSWSSLDTRAPGLFTYAYVSSNAAGKLAAMWTKASGVGQTDIAIASYSGSAWSAPVTETVGTGGAGASAGGLAVGVYSNGDPVVVWYDSVPNTPKVYVQRYRLGTSSWDAPDKAFDGRQSGQVMSFFVDASDRLTLVFADATNGHTTAVRNTGSGWSAPADLGLPLSGVGFPVMDRATGNVAVAVKSNTNNYGVSRIAAAGTVWETPIMSTLTTGQYYALAFDGAHALLAASQGNPTDVEVAFCQ